MLQCPPFRPLFAVYLCGLVCLPLTTLGCHRDASESFVPELPRYQFRVGNNYLYESKFLFEYKGGEMQTTELFDVWVVRENQDGSFRLVIRKTNGAEASESPNAEQLGYCDMHPDGRFSQNFTLGYAIDPTEIFPPLPANQSELQSGWTGQTPSGGVLNYSVATAPTDALEDWQFKVQRQSIEDTIYESSFSGKYTFDSRNGLIRQLESRLNQKFGVEGTGSGTITLAADRVMPEDFIRAFAAEAEIYFAASKKNRELVEQARLDRENFREHLFAGSGSLASAFQQTKSPPIREHIKKEIGRNDALFAQLITANRVISDLFSQPAKDWKLKDLSGQEHSLSDFRGRVVVLDFWYRGAGLCIRAMPQVKEIAKKFADAPVTVLGMNIDAELSSARFVEQTMELNYPSLQAGEVMPQYGLSVSGLPTIIVLDPTGKVSDIHVGYSPNLVANVTASIEKLLSQIKN
jgi:peroxiredoxin